jgi:hypothetical protein
MILRKVFDRLKEYSNLAVAAFTLMLAASAIYQFCIMDGQLDETRKDKQAWMTIGTSTTPLFHTGQQPVTVRIVEENFGKTPAGRPSVAVRHRCYRVVPGRVRQAPLGPYMGVALLSWLLWLRCSLPCTGTIAIKTT